MKNQNVSAQDPRFAEKVRESFLRQGLMRTLGADLTHVGHGATEIRVKYREELSQEHGYFHGAVTGAIADTACGYAAYSLTPPKSTVLTVEYKLNLLAPAQGDELIARANVIRAGRTLAVCRADVHVLRAGAEALCGTLLATIMVMPASENRPEG